MAHGEAIEGEGIAQEWKKSWITLIQELEKKPGEKVTKEAKDAEEVKDILKENAAKKGEDDESEQIVDNEEMNAETAESKKSTIVPWRQESEARLSDLEKQVIWGKGTEMPGTGKYNKFYPPQGYFACKVRTNKQQQTNKTNKLTTNKSPLKHEANKVTLRSAKRRFILLTLNSIVAVVGLPLTSVILEV